MKILSFANYKKWDRCFCCTSRFFLAHQTTSRFYGTTHYDTLGVKPEATQAEIKNAYLRLSKELHPDVNQNDPKSHEKFVKIQTAYNVLSKLSDKNQYDVDLRLNRMSQERNRERQQNSRQQKHPYNSGPFESNHDWNYYDRYTRETTDFDSRKDGLITLLVRLFFIQIFIAIVVMIITSGSRHGVRKVDKEKYRQHVTLNMQKMNPDTKLKLEEAKERAKNKTKEDKLHPEDLSKYE